MKKNNAIRETRRDRIFLNVLLAISVIILIIELYPLVYVVSASFSSSGCNFPRTGLSASCGIQFGRL